MLHQLVDLDSIFVQIEKVFSHIKLVTQLF